MLKQTLFLTVLIASASFQLLVQDIETRMQGLCVKADSDLTEENQFWSALDFLPVLWEGALGNIYDSEDDNVVKVMAITEESKLSQIQRELTILTATKSFYDLQSIIDDGCFYNVFVNESNTDQADKLVVYVRLKKLEGNYPDVLKNGNSYTKQGMWHLDAIIKISRAVKRFHSLGYIHRDLKVKNIMCFEDSNFTAFTPVIIGFDTAVRNGEVSSDSLGTLYYQAPEIGQQVRFTEKVDVFSLGRLAFYLINPDVVEERDYKSVPEDCSGSTHFSKYYCDPSLSELNDFIQRMMAQDPDQRPTMDEVIAFFIQFTHQYNTYVKSLDKTEHNKLKLRWDQYKQGQVSLTDQQAKKLSKAIKSFPISRKTYANSIYQMMKVTYDNDHPIWSDFREVYGDLLQTNNIRLLI